jgi:tetratricopeptide (TPR) repeat protein
VNSPQLKLSKGRKWLFALTVTVVAPLVVLGIVEAVLRVAGYGYATSYFKPIRIQNEDFLVENDKFGLRFFPAALARSPAPLRMPARKAPGTYRIFIIGESAALGDPRPAYGPARYLQALLEERFPKTRFEVICAAVTAINSHAIVPIARECAKRDGDLWIIYMGNNEMVGPFGATTVFGSRAPPWWEVRIGLAIQRLRVGQLLMAWARKISGSSKNASSWGGMQLFMKQRVAPGAPSKEVVYENFKRNLADILEAGRGSGAKLLLNTVAVNLKDCAPFASVGSSALSEAQRSEAVKLTAEGLKAQAGGVQSEALQYFQRAAVIETNNADCQFRLAACYLNLTNGPAARAAFERARDLDALPFRADSRIDGEIGSAAKDFARFGVVFFDAAGFISTNSPMGVPGDEYFYEHVHFNFDGSYRLARQWAEEMEGLLPAGIKKAGNAEWPAQEICEQRLGLTDWNRLGVWKDVLDRVNQPLFKSQLNHDVEVERVQAQIHELEQRMGVGATGRASEVYAQAIKRAPEDFRLHENFAEFLEGTGELSHAIGEWQAARDLIPHHHVAYFQAGRLLARIGKVAEAEDQLRRSLQLRPDLSEGWFELGKVHVIAGKFEVALDDFRRAIALSPMDYRLYYHIGTTLLKLNRRKEAMEQFRLAIEHNPNYWQAHYSLGEELAFDNQISDARREFEQVLGLKPDYAMAHLNLGVTLVKQGDLENAARQFEETLRLQPRNPLAADYLRQLRTRKP